MCVSGKNDEIYLYHFHDMLRISLILPFRYCRYTISISFRTLPISKRYIKNCG